MEYKPEDENHFANRPFTNLTGFRASSCHNQAASEADRQAEDSGLFLRAIENMTENMAGPEAGARETHGFILSELAELPELADLAAAKKMRHSGGRRRAGIMRAKNVTNTSMSTPGQKAADASETAAANAAVSEASAGAVAAGGQERGDGQENEFLAALGPVIPLKKGRGRSVAPAARRPGARGALEPSFSESVEQSLGFALYYSEEYLEGHVVGMDEMSLNRLKMGQYSPEAHLDLHGLNAMQAFECLRDFLRQAWFRNLRCVLVVTGRGRNSPQGTGVLRHKLQAWLTQEPFKRVVLAFCTARPHDGGPGSIYVLLRRFRKKGHIAWQRLPSDPDLY